MNAGRELRRIGRGCVCKRLEVGRRKDGEEMDRNHDILEIRIGCGCC
jgi:hypothetical protein